MVTDARFKGVVGHLNITLCLDEGEIIIIFPSSSVRSIVQWGAWDVHCACSGLLAVGANALSATGPHYGICVVLVPSHNHRILYPGWFYYNYSPHPHLALHCAHDRFHVAGYGACCGMVMIMMHAMQVHYFLHAAVLAQGPLLELWHPMAFFKISCRWPP